MQSRFVFKRATKVPTTIGLIVGDSLRVKNVAGACVAQKTFPAISVLTCRPPDCSEIVIRGETEKSLRRM
jgi:hypothetical protein